MARIYSAILNINAILEDISALELSLEKAQMKINDILGEFDGDPRAFDIIRKYTHIGTATDYEINN